jgi:bifunctional DNA-binding transcriptional regulator/antitoxin component of YhaV-PrlF toxin-antitoxin module
MAPSVSQAKVSYRGQTSIPSELRRRWGIEEGGQIAFVDLGDSALVLPGGTAEAKAELKRVLERRYEVGLAMIEDPELADQ